MPKNPLRRGRGGIWCRLKFFEGVNTEILSFCCQNIKKDRPIDGGSKTEVQLSSIVFSEFYFNLLQIAANWK